MSVRERAPACVYTTRNVKAHDGLSRTNSVIFFGVTEVHVFSRLSPTRRVQKHNKNEFSPSCIVQTISRLSAALTDVKLLSVGTGAS